MANRIEMVIAAQNAASAVIEEVANAVGGLTSGLVGLVTSGGPLGLAVAGSIALAGASVAVANAVADEVEQLDNLSRATGASADQIQVLRRVTVNQGLAQDSALESMRFLNRAIADQNPLLARLGITTTDAHEALLQLSDLFTQSSDTAAKNRIAMTLLGRSGSDLIAVLHDLRLKQAEVRDQLGDGVFSQKVLDNAREWDALMEGIGTRFQGTMNVMKGAVASFVNDSWGRLQGVVNLLKDAGSLLKAAYTGNDFSLPDRGPQHYRISGRNAFGPMVPGGGTDLADALGGDGGSIVEYARRNLDAITNEWIRAEVNLKQSLPPGSLIAALLGTGGGVATRGTPGFSDFMAQFRRDNAEIASIAESAAYGISDGFASAFANMTSQTQTFASAVKAIFLSMEQAILAAIGRIVAKWALIGLGTLIGGPIGGFIGGVASMLGASAPRASVTNVHINALDDRSFADAYRSPFGGARRAGDTLAFGTSMA